jgi:uncharacterized protein (UPF0335 family)
LTARSRTARFHRAACCSRLNQAIRTAKGHIEEEIKELNEGKREIFQEAKSNGFDVKVIRGIVSLRKQDQKEREAHP